MDDALFARLLFDLMFPARLAESLRAEGFDVAEVRSLPTDVQRDDWALLATAARERRAVVTCNYSDRRSNFCAIHEEWQTRGREHAGIILVPYRHVGFGQRRWDVRRRLVAFLNHYAWDGLYNQLLWLP